MPPARARLAWLLAGVLHVGGVATAAGGQPASSPPQVTAAERDEASSAGQWAFSASVYGYLVPEDRNYAQPSVTADRGRLHLEARFNYEDLQTGSVWAGCNFTGGDALTWEITPMLGGVFGEATGVAPGYRGALGWRWLEISSEGEYVWDSTDTSASFLYNWSELGLVPTPWLRAGLVTQRTRAYRSDREIQRGVFVGVSFRALDTSVYLFNPDDSRPIVVVAVSAAF